ncbi:E3 ubiquitin-protein ligase RING1 [Rhynchospora pubera]|uniref:E3 ubiquitin-protein ligase RING1 n=1 Tax=Rhynchospora pubera TaxID=906938 RepID=A0AAV8EFM0_9POAL|nr:E3 ubiquitin-protein ligase RING1 [Rhynchospora pubera]
MDQIQPDLQCLVCTQPFFLESDMTDSLESLAICSECKLMVSNTITQQIEQTAPSHYLHPNRNRRSRSRRYNSRHARTELVDDSDSESFALAFSQLINSARQSQNSTPNQSNRWPALSSENESETHDVMDVSIYGESESNVSFGGYGGDSDASFDRQSVVDRETFLLLNNEFSNNNNSDIDPMHTGLHIQWDSDEEDEGVSEWEEESERDEAAGFTMETPPRRPPRFPNSSPYHEGSPSPSLSPSPSPIPQWMRSRWQMGPLEIEIRQPFVGDPLDYVDEVTVQFEDILEQLADEADDVRRGAAPTSANYREKLPHVIVTQEHVRDKGGLICAVCKDPMHVNCRVLQLPCKHMYHPACILPWLRTRNTCPVCRYELPCEDPDRDKARREELERALYDTNGEEIEIEEDEYEEEEEDEEVRFVESEREVGGRVNGRNRAVQRSNGGGGVRGRWLFLAAAPIVSLVGIVLVFCFRNSSSGNSAGVNGGDSREGGARPERVSDSSRKRWWSIF